MNLNFIINNTSITRFSYDKRIDMEVSTDDYYNQYCYRNFKYLENFYSNNLTSKVRTDNQGNIQYDNISEYSKKNIKPIEDLYVPNNVSKSLYPVYDSINNNGGSMYMSSTANSRTINFSNIVVPINSDKFIVRFAPLFDYKQINLLNLADEKIIITHDYMILTISIYVHNLLFIELGFSTNGNIYINNDRNRDIADDRNKIDISETSFQLLKTKVLYNSFYIVLDRDLADVRFYDPYYYIYDEESYMTIPKTSNEYTEYLFNRIGLDDEIKYIENNMDFLTVYKKCKYNNKLDINGNQLVNVVINSKYMDNISIGNFINKYKNTRSKNFKEEYLKKYTELKFEKRKNELEHVKIKLKQKIIDAINTKLTYFYEKNNTNKDFQLNTNIEHRKFFEEEIYKYFKTSEDGNIANKVSNAIDDCFENKIYKTEEFLKNNFIREMLEGHRYANAIYNFIMLKTDATVLLLRTPLRLNIELEDDNPENNLTPLQEDFPLAQIHESFLLKYRKFLIVDIYNTIFNIVTKKAVDIITQFSGNSMYDFVRKTLGVGTTDDSRQYIRPIQMTDSSALKEVNVNNFDKLIYGEFGCKFENSKKPEYDAINYNNLNEQPLMEYIIHIITNELLNEYYKIIYDLTITEKTQIENTINSTLSQKYSIVPETYKYNIYIDKFQMLYLVPYDKNNDMTGNTIRNTNNISVEYSYNNNEYEYTIDTIFDASIPDKIKFKDVMDNYILSEANVMVEENDVYITNKKVSTDT